MQRILIVEDEEKIMKVLSDFLHSQGYKLIQATDGEDALKQATTKNPDLIILDIMLPKKSGFDVCKELRQSKVNIPIIMLTAKGEEIDKIMGLELGDDDYITKPFSLRELHARMRALLRRANGIEKDIDYYELPNVKIDLKSNLIMKKGIKFQGTKFPLSVMEAKLLKYLILHRGEVLSRAKILDDVWGYDIYPTTRTIDTHILNLRKKIEDDPNQPKAILTIHGGGYKFVG